LDVAVPIVSVVPSLHGPVLAVLARTRAPLRQAEIHRLAAAGSYSGVRKVLLQLVEHGVVEEVPGGFRLNRDHVAADAIVQLASLHGVLVERLRQWAAGHAGIQFVGLFGSIARRDGDESSDIDVLIVADLPSEDRSAMRDELTDLLVRWTGNDGHVQVLAPDAVRRLVDEQAAIVDAWVSDLQPVLGQPPFLRRSVRE
jgi:predicted nucleotidyltransferase